MSNTEEAIAAWLKSFGPIPETIVAWLAAWLRSLGPVLPVGLSISDTQVSLGHKARSTIYEAVSDGRLDAIKDGSKVLITIPSIVRYVAAMPPAKIAPQPPRQWTPEAKAKRQRERQQARKPASPRGHSSTAHVT